MSERPARQREVDALEGAHLGGRARMKGVAQAADLEHDVSHARPRRARRAGSRRRSASGSTSARKTKTAVSSLSALGSRPARTAPAMISRREHRPDDDRDQSRGDPATPEQRLTHDDARESGDDHAEAHLDVREALVLGEQGARESDEAVRRDQPDDDGATHRHAEGAGHLRVVARGSEREAEAGPEEQRQQPSHDRHQHEHEQ